MNDNSLEIVMKKIMTGSLLCCLMIVLIAAVCFFSIKTPETKVCSGKWEVILSLTQNDKEIIVTDIGGNRGIFELPREIKYDLDSRTPFLIRQKIMIDGTDHVLKYRHHPQSGGAVYHLTLKPGEKQRFDLLFMPQWEITFRNWFGWKFASVRQYAGKFNYRRTDLTSAVPKVEGNTK